MKGVLLISFLIHLECVYRKATYFYELNFHPATLHQIILSNFLIFPKSKNKILHHICLCVSLFVFQSLTLFLSLSNSLSFFSVSLSPFLFPLSSLFFGISNTISSHVPNSFSDFSFSVNYLFVK